MKTGWHKKGRKERLEHLSWKGDGLSLAQGSRAWLNLMESLAHMGHKEARPPKFNDLLLAMIKADVTGKKFKE